MARHWGDREKDMRRFKNILAVYDERAGSEAALEHAVALARANGARLTLVNPIGEKSRTASALEAAEKRLRRIVPWIVQEGVTDVDTAVRVGTPHIEITGQVERDHHDLVIVSAESGYRLKDLLLGTTAITLLRKCPCAVWVVKAERPGPCARILAAVDPCTAEEEDGGVNRKVLLRATALARSQKAALHIMHAWTPDGDDAALLTNEISDATREGILYRREAACRAAVNTLLADCPVAGLEHEVHLPRGLPQQSIVQLAGRLEVDLVVLGMAGRSGVSRMLVGNTAETVLGAVRCGVLAVKPGPEQPAIAPPLDVVAPVLRRASA